MLTHAYRSLSVLVLVIGGQLLLLGYQVRTREDVRLIRLWAVTAVTPLAHVLADIQSATTGWLDHYLLLAGAQKEKGELIEEVGRLKQEVHHLRRQLATADRAEALKLFLARTPSKMVAARIIGAGTGIGSSAVFIDRGTRDGVVRGMAAVTPSGVVGRISAAYPTSSQVVLITDTDFAAGVISERGHVIGTLKGQGEGLCRVDYVQNEASVEKGDWFYTSGDDRVFPRGLPVGQVQSAEKGQLEKEILVAPSGLEDGLEEVLVILEGMHQSIPADRQADAVELLPPPEIEQKVPTPVSASAEPVPTPEESAPPLAKPFTPPAGLTTDADRLLDRYRQVGEAQGHVFGEGAPGSTPPDFTRVPALPGSQPARPMQPERAPAAAVQPVQ